MLLRLLVSSHFLSDENVESRICCGRFLVYRRRQQKLRTAQVLRPRPTLLFYFRLCHFTPPDVCVISRHPMYPRGHTYSSFSSASLLQLFHPFLTSSPSSLLSQYLWRSTTRDGETTYSSAFGVEGGIPEVGGHSITFRACLTSTMFPSFWPANRPSSLLSNLPSFLHAFLPSEDMPSSSFSRLPFRGGRFSFYSCIWE